MVARLSVTTMTLIDGLRAADEVSDSATKLLDSLLRAVPRVGVALVVLVLAWALARGVRWTLRRWLSRGQTPSFTTVMSKIAGWGVLTVGFLAAVTIVFPSVKPVDLLAGLGFFSLAVGFAFQDILENLLSGVLLLFRQPFRSGDQITVNDLSGTVEAITIRETRITTFDGQLVIIPNRDVYKGVITVLTHYPSRRISFIVGIAYENDADEACAVIERALAPLPRVDAKPGPEALVVELGVSTVDIDVRLWCGPDQHETRVTLDRAVTAAKRALEEAGIEMPADIVALQATPSLAAALHDRGGVTPAGGVRADD